MCVVSATGVKPLMGLRRWTQQPATATTTTTTAAAEADTASAAGGFMVDNLPNIHNLNISKSNLTLQLNYFDIKTYNKTQLTEGCVNHD